MEIPPVSPETTVSEALASSRQLASVFNAHKTACVGCPLARFCALHDVAANYGMPLESLLAELRQVLSADEIRTQER